MSRPALPSAEPRDAKRQHTEVSSPFTSSPTAAEPTATTESSDSTAAAAAEEMQSLPHSPSIAQRCHTDALHCVFAFLRFQELLPALHSCRGWYAAGCKEPPRALDITVMPRHSAHLVASPLRRHVTDLAFSSSPPLRMEQLRLLRAMPRLTALDVWVDDEDLTGQLGQADWQGQGVLLPLSGAFPPQLCSLTLRSRRPSTLQPLVAALPSQLAGLRSLRLEGDTSELDLAPLLLLPQLHSMALGSCLTLGQCAAVKQLAAVAQLEIGQSWRRETLLELLQPPHRLQQLQQTQLGRVVVDSPLLAALLTLPALTALQPSGMMPDCWGRLGGLRQLHTLSVSWAFGFSAAQQSALESSLSALPQLSDLAVGLGYDAHVDGPALAFSLPALRTLRLLGLRVPSLSFLQHSPLLEQLRLTGCQQLSAADLLHCLPAHTPRLRTLHLHGLPRLSAEQQLQLRPPSALLPSLDQFIRQ